MYYIGVCDDEKVQREKITRMCDDFFKSHGQAYECVEFSSGEEVLDYKGNNLHLLFLDIEMGGISGLEVLRAVEYSDAIWRIVFISNHEELVWDTFSLKTLDFGRKPVSYEQLERWLNIVLRNHKENIVYEFQTGDEKHYFSLDKILYFEAVGNFTNLYTINEKIMLGGHLKLWQERLGDIYFVRAHRSYLANIYNIKKVYCDRVIMSDGTKIVLGRKYYKTIKERYISFTQKRRIKDAGAGTQSAK